jgi:hypothetical protein
MGICNREEYLLEIAGQYNSSVLFERQYCLQPSIPYRVRYGSEIGWMEAVSKPIHIHGYPKSPNPSLSMDYQSDPNYPNVLSRSKKF